MSDKSTGLSLAILLLGLSMLAQLAFGIYRNHVDKQLLQTAVANQEATINEVQAVRQQLNSIAGKTLELAQQGNANAASVIEQMKAAGVNFTATQ